MYVNVRIAKKHVPRVQGLGARDIHSVLPHIPTLEFIFINLIYYYYYYWF